MRRSTRPYADSQLTTQDRKSTRLNSSHVENSYAVFCLKKKNTNFDTLPQVFQMSTQTWRNLSTAQLALPLYPKMMFFFFNDTATTEIYTLSLHDALPI